MGNSPISHTYSIPVNEKETEERTAIYRSPLLPSELVENLVDSKIKNCWELFELGCTSFPDRPCLGRRTIKPDGSPGGYAWVNYAQVRSEALKFGTALMRRELCPVVEFPEERVPAAQNMRVIGVFMTNCPEWIILEQAANAFGLTLVPLYETLGQSAMEFVANQTKLPIVLVSDDSFTTFQSVLKNITSVKSVVVVGLKHNVAELDALLEEWRNSTPAGVTLFSYFEMIRFGTLDVLPPADVESDVIETVCYTSGTTAEPKGVLFTHAASVSNICALLRGPFTRSDLIIDDNHVHISYLPLAHIFERAICNVMLTRGSCIGFYRGDTLQLLDDVQELKPTIFVSVPRLYYRIDEKIKSGVQQKSVLARYLFEKAMAAKLANFRKTGTVEHPLWDRLVFGKTKSLLGGKLKFLISGGAALEAAVEERIQIMFCTPMIQGYGLTETLGPAFITNPIDPVTGHVGGPTPWVEFCLESVPELNYLTSSDPAMGELLMRGPAMFCGYFRAPSITREVLDPDGWFHSGDIAVLLPNGAVKLIDRKKNLFKLSQGEYISPEKVEGVYVQSLLVSQIFVYGDSKENFLVAIVVPDVIEGQRWLNEKHNSNTTISAEDLASNAALKQAILDDMNVIGSKLQLRGFEKVKQIHVHPEPFTVENGLLTPTMKLKRNCAKDKFASFVEQLYKKNPAA